MSTRHLPVLGLTVALAAAVLAGGCDRTLMKRPAIRQDNFHQARGAEQKLIACLRVSEGRLTLDRADADDLYNLDLRWDAANMKRRVDFSPGESARLELALEGDSPDEAIEANLSIAGDLPLELSMETGAGESRLDLTGLTVSRINIVHGVGQLRVTIDEPQEADCRSMEVVCGVGETVLRGLGNLMPGNLDLKGGLGQARVGFDGDRPGRTNAQLVVGIGNLDITFPESLGVRILNPGDQSGRLSVPKDRFERRSGAYVSSNYRQARQFVEMSVKPGLGSVSFKIQE